MLVQAVVGIPRGVLVTGTFRARFEELFTDGFPRLFRFLDRQSGDPDLAADLAQEAFARLYQRGALPDTPDAWLVTVALNRLRNVRAMKARRARLLTDARAAETLADPPASPAQSAERDETRRRVRAVIDRLPERERDLLLLRAEGYSYRSMAAALGLNEASVGTLLARAKDRFRDLYGGDSDAP